MSLVPKPLPDKTDTIYYHGKAVASALAYSSRALSAMVVHCKCIDNQAKT